MSDPSGGIRSPDRRSNWCECFENAGCNLLRRSVMAHNLLPFVNASDNVALALPVADKTAT